MASISEGAVKKPVTTALVFAAIVILGIFSYRTLPLDLLPDIESNNIMVMTTYSGASAADVEMNVSKPIENTLNGVSDLKHLTSTSRENISIVGLEFDYGIDIDVATNDVRDKLELVKSSLPDDAENPVIFKFGTDDIPVIIIGVSADESTGALYKILDDQVASPLARISGVGTVSISGAAEREVNVYCDPYKLNAYGLTIAGISQTIGLENRNTPGGNLDFGSDTYALRVQGEFNDSKEMLDLVVGMQDGKVVYLRDVARLDDSLEERFQEAYMAGKRGATLMIQKQSGANTVQIAEQIHQRLPAIQATLPSDIKMEIITDTSTNTVNTVNSLAETIIITLVIVMAVVFIFLGRWRATIIIVTVIPISLIASFIYLGITGNTLNIISLSALSLAIGMVVDDSIVVLENISTHIERGSKPRQAAIFATKEVMTSVVASCLTMLSVFIPLTMMSGMTGVLFKQLGWIVAIIMVMSATSALTLIPMMSSKLLKLDQKKGKLYTLFFTPIEKGLSALSNGYARLLSWSVHHRKTVIGIAVAAFVAIVFFLAPSIKSEFFPAMDNARLSVTAELPIGTRQDITREVALKINDELYAKYPEIKASTYTLGQAASDNIVANLSDNGANIINYTISLTDKTKRERGQTEIAELIRADLAEYSELSDYEVGSGMMGVGGESSVEVEIYGFDFNRTDEVAAEVARQLEGSPYCAQVNISRGDYIPEIQVDFDREKLALHGLNVTTVASYLRNSVNGYVASYYREDGEEYDIRVRLAPEYRETIDDIENVVVYDAFGKGVRVRDLGTVVERMTPPTIERKNRERVITVTGIVSPDAALSDLVGDVQQFMPKVDLPQGITWQLAGSFEDQQDTFSDIGTLLILIIILIYIVMASQFESMVDPFVIMLALPFAFIGVILGLSITGTPLGLMGMVGILIIVGVVAKNGIVLIDYIRLCREKGMGIINAVVTAGKSRLRPVLMTTLTTVLGMVPMAIGTGEGAEMWNAMGITVAWGVSIGTLVTLVLVPVIYCVFAGGGVKRQRRENAKMEVLEILASD